jgi:hypothetical protein
MVHSASTSPAMTVLQMWFAVLQMQLMRRSAPALSALVKVLSQLEELRTESMVHSARALSAWADVLSQLVELWTESMLLSARALPAMATAGVLIYLGMHSVQPLPAMAGVRMRLVSWPAVVLCFAEQGVGSVCVPCNGVGQLKGGSKG